MTTSCLALKSYFQLLFTSCSSSIEDRQNTSKIKLEGQILTQEHLVRDCEKKIEDLENRKSLLVKQRNIAEAKKVVKEKHKEMAKLKQNQGLLEYTQTLFDSINNTAIMRSTMETLSEAQTLFKNIDAPKIYKKFDKMSNEYLDFRDNLSNTQELMSDRMGDALPSITDAELEAELAALDLVPAVEPAETTTVLPSVPFSTPVAGVPAQRAVATAYAAFS